jgi:SAM-dependent methyltransferase
VETVRPFFHRIPALLMRHQVCSLPVEMFPQPISGSARPVRDAERAAPRKRQGFEPVFEAAAAVVSGVDRRWRRERRRRKVGRAYDMALEIARVIPHGSQVLDVGCGNGFIAHHLTSMLGKPVMGIDVAPTTEARIDFRCFDGQRLPVPDRSFDAVLLCYVLHHAQDLQTLLNEFRRVLRHRGKVIVYEDIPRRVWDRVVCWIHDRQWRRRAGPCTFQLEQDWLAVFGSAGLEVVTERSLSRWRNLAHPVSRHFFLLRLRESADHLL